MSKKTLQDLKVDAHIAVLHTKVDSLIEKQKELTGRVRANEKVVAAIGLLGSIALAFIGAGYFAPKAEACSPRLDGEPTYCPPWDTVILEEPKGITDQTFEDNLDPDVFDHNQYEVTIFDSRDDDPFNVAHTGHSFPTWPTAGEMIEAIRQEEAKRNRNSIEEMLNNTLMEYEYGSDGSTESEELLQLSSDRDQSGFRW
tara:strand:- start:16 stop:612 length:597 start_codon:yes stop_codon:yes gene_type:complete